MKQFDNFTLNRKFTCIICFVLAMTVLGTGAGLWITYHSGNKLLYEATKESLDHSSSVIAERLSNIEDMTGMILQMLLSRVHCLLHPIRGQVIMTK